MILIASDKTDNKIFVTILSTRKNKHRADLDSIYKEIKKYFEDKPVLNVNETPVISKSGNLSCIPNSTNSQILNKHLKEQTISETKNLRAEMIALKSFVVDQIFMMKKRSNDQDDELLIKNYFDQTDILKQELKSKDTIIKIILENYKQTVGYKPQIVKKTLLNKITIRIKGKRIFNA